MSRPTGRALARTTALAIICALALTALGLNGIPPKEVSAVEPPSVAASLTNDWVAGSDFAPNVGLTVTVNGATPPNQSDVIRGNAGPDIIRGGDGDDTLLGGEGADTLYGGFGFDKCSGNTGPDSAQAATCEQTPGVETLF
jgi:hypothetical protein